MAKKSNKFTLKISLLLILFSILAIFTIIIVWEKPYRSSHVAQSISGQSINNKPICANSISCIKDLSGKPETENRGVYQNKIVYAPEVSATLAYISVLGQTTNPQEKHIYVNLSTQRLYAYDGNKLLYEFPISSGKWKPTPVGNYSIWIKLKATRMEGGNPAIGTYYNLPNVPYTMFFYNDSVPKSMGYSLHGAYWHNNFGHPMSHGCVNISPENAKKLFDWADPPTISYSTYATPENPGTSVTIFGETPEE